MEIKDQGKRKLYKRLKSKYRFVVMNDDTFEEKVSLRLTPLNVYTIIGVTTLLLITFGVLIVAFTPLRQYIPGYTDMHLKKQSFTNALVADSLARQKATNDRYLNNIRAILLGADSVAADSILRLNEEALLNYSKLEIRRSPEEIELINRIEAEDKYNLAFDEPSQGINAKLDFLFMTPLNGLIITGFQPAQKHYGIDIVAKKDEPVKATLDGKVVLATWTSETGNVIAVQHKNNLISFYKHNAVLLKQAGDYVTAGEAIAIVGNSGELTSGPHLHFELWHNGTAIDPQNFIAF